MGGGTPFEEPTALAAEEVSPTIGGAAAVVFGAWDSVVLAESVAGADAAAVTGALGPGCAVVADDSVLPGVASVMISTGLEFAVDGGGAEEVVASIPGITGAGAKS